MQTLVFLTIKEKLMHNDYFKLTLPRAKKFLDSVEVKKFTELMPFTAKYFKTKEHLKFCQIKDFPLSPISKGEKWGQAWDSAWFLMSADLSNIKIPSELIARLDFNGEAIVFSPDGIHYQGLTNGSVFAFHSGRNTFTIPRHWIKNNKLEFWVEASASSLFGVTREKDPSENCPHPHGHYSGIYNDGTLLTKNNFLSELRRDISYLSDLLTEIPADSVRHIRILKAIDEALNGYYQSNGENQDCILPLKKVLNSKANESTINIYAIGHAHIDTGWLWPVRETIRKCARTFTSQLRLMEIYPEYKFGASQPQLYQFAKDHHPEVYEQIKERVKEGRWECQGGMWVEADCNLISGESFVRQIFYGKKFYQDEFGIDVKNVWLPDVFGYSAAMPQIMRKSGVEYFMTQKISWSQFNKFPHHSFWWKGLDGTKILTHFLPEDTYNSQLKASTLIKAERNYKDKAVSNNILSLFGIGDGGGGPNQEQIERGLRAKNLESCPKVTFSKAEDFFEKLKPEAENFATWDGELYLELHRGTLTTQAYCKKMNRKLEFKLRNLELLYASTDLGNYPKEAIEKLWKVLLINQFHDILPGSSINLVYKDTHREYGEMIQEINQLTKQWESRNAESDSSVITILNSNSSEFNGLVEIPDKFKNEKSLSDGKNFYSVQNAGNKTYVAIKIPSLEKVILSKGTGVAPSLPQKKTAALILENDLISYEFNAKGRLLNIIDKKSNYNFSVPNNESNVLTIYDDHPHNWDAWDIDVYYEKCPITQLEATNYEIVSEGTAFKQIKFNYQFGKSSFTQLVTLTQNAPILEINHQVNWQEKHKMLRVAFPANIPNGKAYYDIAYGYIERPNNRNTTWDLARFECATHKYAGLSSQSNGFFVLNDCKYGYKIVENVIDVCLLRSPTDPDPEADTGSHEFKLSLFPNQDHFSSSNVISEALQFNNPPMVLNGKLKKNIPIKLNSSHVTLETVKKCEYDNSVIVRLVENKGKLNNVTVSLPDHTKCVETDLMEKELSQIKITNNQMNLSFTPFEIKTFKIF